MSRKAVLLPIYVDETSAASEPLSLSLADDFTTLPTNVMYQDVVCYQINVDTSDSEGTFYVQISEDYSPRDGSGSFVDMGIAGLAEGTDDTIICEIDPGGRAFIRLRYESDSLNASTITAIADVAGSLNSKYFLASSRVDDYYFWLDNGTGVDPAIADRTGIQVVYTDDDSAATIAGLVRTAAASKGWTVTGASDQIILTNLTSGSSLAAAAGDSGFTVSNVAATGTATILLTAKPLGD